MSRGYHETRAADVELNTPSKPRSILGSANCSVSKRIVDADDRRVGWLGSSSAGYLTGRNLRQDLLDDDRNWTLWESIAVDLRAAIQDATSARTSYGRRRWVQALVSGRVAG